MQGTIDINSDSYKDGISVGDEQEVDVPEEAQFATNGKLMCACLGEITTSDLFQGLHLCGRAIRVSLHPAY